MGRPFMRLIVAEVIAEEHSSYDVADLRPEGCTWYPDARVWCITRDGTPPFFRRTDPAQRRPRRQPLPT